MSEKKYLLVLDQKTNKLKMLDNKTPVVNEDPEPYEEENNQVDEDGNCVDCGYEIASCDC